MEYVVYCDESRHDGGKLSPYMAIGGLWVPRSQKEAISRGFRDCLRRRHLGAEVKWNKVSRKRFDDYKALVDYFFANDALKFRAIVVEESKVDYAKFHGGDRELGFYKFYFEMLEKWLIDNNQYLVLLDFKRNKGTDRLTSLRRALEKKIRGRAWISDLAVINSRETPLAQLVDLLTGAVAATCCEFSKPTAKSELAAYIAAKRGASLGEQSPNPKFEKINIFRIHLD